MKSEINLKTLLISISIILTVLIGFLLLRINLLQNPDAVAPQAPQNINLWTIFLTGLFTGGLTCLAVQGGLLAATIAQNEEEKLQEKTQTTGNALPILSFLISKLVAYTALGFLLGWFGSLFQLSLLAQIIMQFAVIIFMLGTAGNILNIHPLFRYFVIQPPKFLTRLVRNQSKSKSIFAPALLGAFTIFIPCGTTQAMMALSIGSQNPFLGAAVLFSFVLGTSPLFFTLGIFATRLGDSLHQKFMKLAAFALVILAVFNLNNVLALTGSPWTLENIFRTRTVKTDIARAQVQEDVVISIQNYGYSPNNLSVKTGSNVTFTIENKGVYTCAAAFTIPYFNYQKVIRPGVQEKITLKMPDKPTQIPFMCSMGMYRGVINVI